MLTFKATFVNRSFVRRKMNRFAMEDKSAWQDEEVQMFSSLKNFFYDSTAQSCKYHLST
jgi:hypothetical protein